MNHIMHGAVGDPCSYVVIVMLGTTLITPVIRSSVLSQGCCWTRPGIGVCTVLCTVQGKDPWNDSGDQVSLRSAVAAQGKARVWHGAPHRAGQGPFCEQGESHEGSQSHCMHMGIQQSVQGFPRPLHSLVICLVSFYPLITPLITSVHDMLRIFPEHALNLVSFMIF